MFNRVSVAQCWKVAGSLPNVELRLSDKRLCQIINNIQLIPFPESKNPVILGPPIEPESTLIQSLSNNPEQTLEAVEGMIPIQMKKKMLDLHIDEGANENNEDKPFFRLTLESIVAKTKIKTFDMEFDASLANSVVYHEQFIGKDNQQLRLLSAQLEQINNDENQKLVSLNFLHTSSENPLFLSPTYNGIENRAHVHFNVPAGLSLKIDADLEEFRIILASKQAKLFDIQVQGVKAYVSQAPEKTLVNLILSDLLRVLDPYKDA
ncbi:unnamed protein product [Rotaria socialis]|uniref:Uncharacterized protein n=1 Tax=Rotaria socialis TaxID=392032 RepID=A0A817RXG8_9BILA|nr:unnamed protein product [Rotaria socialis]